MLRKPKIGEKIIGNWTLLAEVFSHKYEGVVVCFHPPKWALIGLTTVGVGRTLNKAETEFYRKMLESEFERFAWVDLTLPYIFPNSPANRDYPSYWNF